MHLVVVESPAKCSKIASFLGPEYRVLASMGHIRALKEELDAIGLAKDFEPSYMWIKEKAKAIAQLREAAQKASRVYLAADDDREGEAIAYSVCLLLHLDPNTTPRAVFHEITKDAVTSAIQNPRTLNMDRVHAQQSRAMLDMMIGFTMSPLLWKHVGSALSAGRCQTPALRLVCEREDAITSFKSSSSWRLSGTFAKKGSKIAWSGHMADDLEDRDSAEAYLENHSTEPGAVVTSATTGPWSESAPLPLITSTLQQQASSLFRSNPKGTMKIAQRLYEAGHITYMRTDKAVLGEEAKKQAQDFVSLTYGSSYLATTGLSTSAKLKAKKSKATGGAAAGATGDVKAQEAHEAIRPTHMDLRELPSNEDWSALDRKVYRLVWLRTIQSVMAPVRGDQRTIVLALDGDGEDFPWRATWRRTTFEGWRKTETTETKAQTETDGLDTPTDQEQWEVGEALQQGDRIEWINLVAAPHHTRASRRLNEATLVKELETKGIGRPSTFASLISTILDKKYVEIKSIPSTDQVKETLTITRKMPWPPTKEQSTMKVGAEKDVLVPTALGRSVLIFLLQHFQDLFDYNFTAKMESRLDQIAEGGEPWKQVLRDTWTAYKDRHQQLSHAKIDKNSEDRRRDLGDGLVAIQTRKGPLLMRESPDGDKEKTVFYGWPSSATLADITAEVAHNFVKGAQKQKEGQVLGEHEGHPIVRKTGPYGAYIECNGVRASCKGDETLEQLIEKLNAPKAGPGRTVGKFEIRTGPYGPYITKKDGIGKKQFVSLPKDKNQETITEAECIAIYQDGIQAKARARAFAGGAGRGGGRGGRGGRGGGRGGAHA